MAPPIQCVRRPGIRRSARCRRFPFALFGLATLAIAPPTRADWLEDFDDGFSNVWSFAATDDGGAPPATGITTFARVEAGSDDHLLMAHSTVALPGGGGGAADVFAWVDESFADLAISADVNAAPAQGQQSVLGVLGRGDAMTGASYLAAVDFSTSRFVIARSDDFFDFQTPLVVDDSLSLDPNATYHIQFFLLGSTLAARLLDADTRAILSTIYVIDGHFTSGGAGVLVETAYQVGIPVAPIIGTFDDVEAVPEPGYGSALVVGVLAIGFRRRGAPVARATPDAAESPT